MTLPAPTRTMAEENAVERQIEKDAFDAVLNRWLDDPDTIADYVRDALVDFTDQECAEIASMVMDGPWDQDNRNRFAWKLRQRIQRGITESVKNSTEYDEEAAYMSWAARNGL